MSEATQSFENFNQWVHMASYWLTGHPKYCECFRAICFDSSGMILSNGADFMRARDSGLFPVYWIWPDQNLFNFVDSVVRKEKP